AVRLLGGGDLVDDRVGALFQIEVALVGQGVGDPFDHLVNVGIVVKRALVFAFLELAGDGEVFDASGDFALAQIGLNGGRAVDAQPLTPEIVVDVNVWERRRRERLRQSRGVSTRG